MSNGNTRIQSNTGEDMIKAVPDGAVELYHDNVKKFETTSAGASIIRNAVINLTGGVAGKGELAFGASGRPFIEAFDSGNHGSGAGMNFRTGAGDYMAKMKFDGAVELYHDNSKKFETTSVGFTAGTLSTSSAGAYMTISDSSAYGLIIDQSASKNIVIRTDGPGIYLQEKTTGQNYIRCLKDAAVELYHNGSKKLETTSYGSQVTGYQVQTNFPIASLSDNNTGNLNTTTLQDSQLNSSNFYSHTNINQGSHFNASTGKFTCPVDGVYRLYIRISSTANANIRLRKNGNTINEAYDSVYSSGEVKSVSSEIIVGCSANDYLDVQVSTLKVISGTQHKQVTFQLIA